MRADCGRVEFSVSDALAQGYDFVAVYTTGQDGSGVYQFSACPDVNARVSFLLPAGQYMLVYGHPTQEGVAYYGYHSTGWAAGTDGLAYVEVTAGQTTRLNDIR